MQTETIKFGEFFEIQFVGEEIEIVSLKAEKANAKDILEFDVEIYDKTEEKEPVLDDGMFREVIGEAQKLIDFMFENRDNFLEKLGLKS